MLKQTNNTSAPRISQTQSHTLFTLTAGVKPLNMQNTHAKTSIQSTPKPTFSTLNSKSVQSVPQMTISSFSEPRANQISMNASGSSNVGFQRLQSKAQTSQTYLNVYGARSTGQIQMNAVGAVAQPSNFNNQGPVSLLGSMINSAKGEFLKNLANSQHPTVQSNAAVISIPLHLPNSNKKPQAGTGIMEKLGKRFWLNGNDVITTQEEIPQSTQDEPDFQISHFSAATAEKPEEQTIVMNSSKASTGGSGGGGPDKDQRPQRKIDPNHTRDSNIVELKQDQSIQDAMKENAVVLFHDSSEPDYSLYNHLANGGVDFAHFDLASISDPSDRAVKMQEIKKSTGEKIPQVHVAGKFIGNSLDVRMMTQTGYFQYKLEQANVKHRLNGMVWIKEQYRRN